MSIEEEIIEINATIRDILMPLLIPYLSCNPILVTFKTGFKFKHFAITQVPVPMLSKWKEMPMIRINLWCLVASV